MCTARGGGQAFLCPEGTRFNQRTLVCDHQFRVSCAESSNFFHRNLIMHEESMAATKKAKTQNKGERCVVKCLMIHIKISISKINYLLILLIPHLFQEKMKIFESAQDFNLPQLSKSIHDQM